MALFFDSMRLHFYISSMISEIQKKTLSALYLVLLPLARAMLRLGVSHVEFSEVAKSAFVDAASAEFGKRGRDTNVSRVAIQTGLSRKEVKRIRLHGVDSFAAESSPGSPVSDLLHRWYTNPDFLDRNGNPISLPYDSGKISFAGLVKSAAGDIPVGAMRTELARLNLIEVNESGLIFVKGRVFVPLNLDERVLNGLDPGMRQLAETFAFNSNPEKPSKTRYQAVVDSPRINKVFVKKINIELRKRLEGFAAEIDDYLARFEASEGDEQVTIGAGIYYFEEEKSPKK